MTRVSTIQIENFWGIFIINNSNFNKKIYFLNEIHFQHHLFYCIIFFIHLVCRGANSFKQKHSFSSRKQKHGQSYDTQEKKR